VHSGLNSKGARVPLRPFGLTTPYDLGHTHRSFVTEYDGGKLDGFDEVTLPIAAVPAAKARSLVFHRKTHG
jgi:hypothetical protein